MRDALGAEPIDQALDLRHHFGTDAVAGEEQQFMRSHDRMPFSKKTRMRAQC
jgi:hypothetical protein